MLPFGMYRHRRLKAWQHAQSLAVAASKVARAFPQYETYALADQQRRAAYSIPLNIAEGSSRRGPREFRRYLDQARSSLAELDTIIELAQRLGYMDEAAHSRLSDLADETGKTLFGLLRKISAAADATV